MVHCQKGWKALIHIVINMKKVEKKAAQYESKKSLDGKMKFLKGNIGKVTKQAIAKKK